MGSWVQSLSPSATPATQPVLEPGPGETPLWPRVRLRALFPAAIDPGRSAAMLAAAVGLPQAAVAVEHVEDRAWEREWLKDFRPMRFGRRLWVCPAGLRPEGPADAILALDPGLAFGTGTHPTTALCLEWLDASDPGRRARARLWLRLRDPRPRRPEARRRRGGRVRHRPRRPCRRRGKMRQPTACLPALRSLGPPTTPSARSTSCSPTSSRAR